MSTVSGNNGFFPTLQRWQKRSRDRARLGAMSERQLKDIGLTVSDAHRESEKPFWKP